MTDLEGVFRGGVRHIGAPTIEQVFSAADVRGTKKASASKTYIHGGMIPPGGMTHGSDASQLGGEMRPSVTLRKTQTVPLRMI